MYQSLCLCTGRFVALAEPSKFFEIQTHESTTEVILSSADFVSRPIIIQAIDDLISFADDNKPARLVVNFENVKQISSEFITAMIRLRDQVVGDDGQLKFSFMSKQVLLPFKITNLASTLFEIHGTTPKAIKAF